MIMRLKNYFQERINRKNRSELTNYTPSLICSNCTGGFLYHWLGLQFRSPFINLYMSNNDFITALENWDVFLKTKIEEVVQDKYPYPVGKSVKGVLIHFVHYRSFQEAVSKWDERIKRLDPDNMAVMLTNFNSRGGNVNLYCKDLKIYLLKIKWYLWTSHSLNTRLHSICEDMIK